MYFTLLDYAFLLVQAFHWNAKIKRFTSRVENMQETGNSHRILHSEI